MKKLIQSGVFHAAAGRAAQERGGAELCRRPGPPARSHETEWVCFTLFGEEHGMLLKMYWVYHLLVHFGWVVLELKQSSSCLTPPALVNSYQPRLNWVDSGWKWTKPRCMSRCNTHCSYIQNIMKGKISFLAWWHNGASHSRHRQAGLRPAVHQPPSCELPPRGVRHPRRPPRPLLPLLAQQLPPLDGRGLPRAGHRVEGGGGAAGGPGQDHGVSNETCWKIPPVMFRVTMLVLN